MRRGLQGRYVRIPSDPEPFDAFVPSPLPPSPPLQFDPELERLRDHAHLALGRLDSLSTLLPDPSFFLYLYVRKEAVLSSQIEGTGSLAAVLPRRGRHDG
jgi:Fic family protein